MINEGLIRRLKIAAESGDLEAKRYLKEIQKRLPGKVSSIEQVLTEIYGDQSNLPPGNLDFLNKQINYSINTWHFIKDIVRYNSELQDNWRKFYIDTQGQLGPKEFIEEIYDIYGDFEINTRSTLGENSPLIFDVEILFWEKDIESEQNFLIRIFHMPVVNEDLYYKKYSIGFFVTGTPSHLLYFMARIKCNNCNAAWESYLDGEWYVSDLSEIDMDFLEEYRIEKIPYGWDHEDIIDERPGHEILWITRDEKKGYCPGCRIGVLKPVKTF